MNRHLASLHLTLITLFFSSATIAQIFKVEPMNNGINTSQYDEISPVVSIDGKTLYFTRVGHPTFDRTLKLDGVDIATQLNENDYQNKLKSIFSKIAGKEVHDPQRSKFNQDIWIAESIFDSFEKISHPSYPLNNALPNSVSALTPNGNELVIINRFSQFGGLDKGFSITRKTSDNEWTFPEPIEIKNYSNNNSDVNLAMSADGNVLILSMQRSDSYGDNDLYVCIKIGRNQWSEPQNLGPKVNTVYRETTPFLSEDGKRLFFSSNRKGSLGGSDIFYLIRTGDNWEDWSVPYRFVEPINSDADDSQPYFNSATGYLYFSSNREGSLDIFKAELMPPNPIQVNVKGRILNIKTDQKQPARILFAPVGEDHLESVYVSDDGTFELSLPKGKTYRLIADRPGFTGKEEQLTFRSDYVYYKTHSLDLYLDPMQVNTKIELKSIFFEQSRAVVLEESYTSLDELAKFLKENWTVSIRIEGHTDNQGDKLALQKLSEERAKAIKQYLVYKKFIQPLRIETVGMGAKMPLNNNKTDKLRAKNRRVGVVITKINNAGQLQMNK
ncbi:MAG: outer membrane protein OmpA-like peptidoglycan-associated protein [Granulosicoccus sp.]|jgi:outer membrane protein OmpA-like peptidoglycan-associated protein/Tol biopolymer transport system component